jgi:hypothetical protein
MTRRASNWFYNSFKFQKYSNRSGGFTGDGYTRFQRKGTNASVFQRGLSDSGSRIIALLVNENL